VEGIFFSQRSDHLFSLGSVPTQIAAGRRPFPGRRRIEGVMRRDTDERDTRNYLHQTREINADNSGWLCAIVEAAMMSKRRPAPVSICLRKSASFLEKCTGSTSATRGRALAGSLCHPAPPVVAGSFSSRRKK